ncbi:MAG: hypothetical protein ABI645_12265 [Pseudomonadota bacterium]
MSNSIRKAWRRYRKLPPIPRELFTLGLMLVVALTVLPLAIWSAGQLFLGDYLRAPADPGGAALTGGPLALLADYVAGIARGSPGHWLALLGPYLLLLAFRAGRALCKS